MKCTDKERETCNVEKMTCKGCYYETVDDKWMNDYTVHKIVKENCEDKDEL